MDFQANQQMIAKESIAERQARQLKESMEKLAAQTKARKEAARLPRDKARTITTTVSPAQIIQTPKHESLAASSANNAKPDWSTCHVCNRPHNPATCFMVDKVAREEFLKGKSKEVKDYWAQKVAGYEGWVVRREANKKKREGFLARQAARLARQEAREAEADLPMKDEEKRAAHQRAVRNMIRNGGGFGRA